MTQRTETRPKRRGSLFGPLLLITIGVIFLLNNIGAVRGDLWNTIFNYWPVLLIVAGLDGFYRREGLVGAAFIIGVGTVFLLANLGYIEVNVWQMIIRLWPLLIVAVGFDILIGRRSLVASIIGLVVILALLAGSLWLIGVKAGGGEVITSQQVSQAIDGATQGRLVIEHAVGQLKIKALTGGSELVAGSVSTHRSVQIRQNFSRQGDTAVYSLRSSGSNITPSMRGDEWQWDLGLTQAIPLNLSVSLGVGEALLDLGDLDLDELNADLGVGKISVELPKEGRFDAQVETAIGEIVIIVPPGMELRVQSDTALAGISAPDGYSKSGDIYTSPNYGNAENQIDLQVSIAIGGIVIQEGR